MISSNGGSFVVELGQALCTYCAIGSHFTQSSCQWLTNILRYCSSHWLVLSNCPLVWGWYAVLMFCQIPIHRHSSLVKVEAKRVSRSLMIDLGIP